MKVILPISQATFGLFKIHAITSAPDDYYAQPHARSSATLCLQKLDADKRQKFLDLYTFAQDESNHPFNICYEVADRTWGEKSHLVALPERNLYIYSSWGYFINHARQCYAYRTCRGNLWGVFKNAQGEYFAFFDGARSVVSSMPAFGTTDQNNTPVFLETTAPSDMMWFENQADYLIRKGESHAVRYFAKQNLDLLTLCEGDAYWHFKDCNANFDSLVYAEMFKNSNPEQYLLNKYRNKRIKPDTFAGKDLIAWNLLDKETQDRILRWA